MGCRVSYWQIVATFDIASIFNTDTLNDHNCSGARRKNNDVSEKSYCCLLLNWIFNGMRFFCSFSGCFCCCCCCWIIWNFILLLIIRIKDTRRAIVMGGGKLRHSSFYETGSTTVTPSNRVLRRPDCSCLPPTPASAVKQSRLLGMIEQLLDSRVIATIHVSIIE